MSSARLSRPRRRRWLRQVAIAAGAMGLLVLIALPLGLHAWLMRQALQRLQQEAAARGLELQARQLQPEGFRTLRLDSVVLRRPGRQPLLAARLLRVHIQPLSLLAGNLRPSRIELLDADLAWVLCDDSLRNLPAGPTPDAMPAAEPALAWSERLHGRLQQLARWWPSSAVLQQVRLAIRTEGGSYQAEVAELRWDADSLHGQMTWEQGPVTVRGAFRPFTVELQRPDSLPLTTVPLLGRLGIGLDAATVRLSVPDWQSDPQTIQAQVVVQARQAALAHRRLASDPIYLDSLAMALTVGVEGNSVRLDSTSRVTLNGVELLPFVHLRLRPDTLVQAHLRLPRTASDRFFAALPPAIFASVHGLQATGWLTGRWDLAYHSERPDSVFFDARLASENFQIQAFGEADLRKLNRSFVHRTYRDGRRIVLGDSNPDFVPLEEISPFLREAVLTSEDGSFFAHNGFNLGALRSAILDNLRRKRFARGASTISMQLVKNVFLTPEKTLGRKLEEALLVWLIEHHRLVPKARMLEVYFNLIEWGPNVYGVAEASRYYFGKHPSQIYPQEAIFLSMIIPRPRSFAWAFDSTAQLRPSFDGYFRLVGGLMVRRGILTPEQDSLLVPPVLDLAAPARNAIRARFGQPDTLPLGPMLFVDPLLDESTPER